jgi:hypothetical protein
VNLKLEALHRLRRNDNFFPLPEKAIIIPTRAEAQALYSANRSVVNEIRGWTDVTYLSRSGCFTVDGYQTPPS